MQSWQSPLALLLAPLAWPLAAASPLLLGAALLPAFRLPPAGRPLPLRPAGAAAACPLVVAGLALLLLALPAAAAAARSFVSSRVSSSCLGCRRS